ncbi:MAG: hypothetical protein HYX78_08985 [Armatimonadetes bacterium]|nr:hypothetical protein [Armatimonadota bacterium]
MKTLTVYLLGAVFAQLLLLGAALTSDCAEIDHAAQSQSPSLGSCDIIGGEWQATDRGFAQRNHDGVSLLVGRDVMDNYTVCVDVRFSGAPCRGSKAGLVLQLADKQNYLVFSLKHKEGGSFAVLRIEVDPGRKITGDLCRVPIKLSNWHRLRADVHGVDICCYLDGRQVASYTFVGTPVWIAPGEKTWPKDLTSGRVGLVTVDTAAEFKDLRIVPLKDFSIIVTPQTGRRDENGDLLPRQSYAETMRWFTDWLIPFR